MVHAFTVVSPYVKRLLLAGEHDHLCNAYWKGRSLCAPKGSALLALWWGCDWWQQAGLMMDCYCFAADRSASRRSRRCSRAWLPSTALRRCASHTTPGSPLATHLPLLELALLGPRSRLCVWAMCFCRIYEP